VAIVAQVGTPYHIASISSLTDLCSKMQRKVQKKSS
jgi:hypothetical protein